MNDIEKVLLTVPEAARRLGLGRTYVYELIGRGDIESLKLGAARRIPVSALGKFVEAKRAEQGY